MLQLNHFSFELPFEYPFTIAKGTKTVQPSLIVSLGLRHWKGFGEAPAITYYNIDITSMIDLLEAKRPFIERYALIDPKRFWHFLHHLFPENNFLVAALDIAGWDLFSKVRNAPVFALLHPKIQYAPKTTDYTIGISDPEEAIEKVKKHPWNCYKIKVRHKDDIDVLIQLRKHTKAAFRIDANESLEYEDVKKLLPEYKKLDVTMLEQPLHKLEWEAMEALKAMQVLPLFADESCVTSNDLPKCYKSFDGINIKLTKCGGITPALEMIHAAYSHDMKIMIGCMNESSVGTAAIAHLSHMVDYIDADGPLLLKNDIAEGITYKNGILETKKIPGLGIDFRNEMIPSNHFNQQ
jgi:L-alanine-DL-glutamate epimerase-like enolase superfamily enzyme